jgi:signal transduction histidine kinase
MPTSVRTAARRLAGRASIGAVQLDQVAAGHRSAALELAVQCKRVSLHDFQRLQERLKSVADPVAFLVNLFAHAPVGFGVWTADGRPLLTNEAFMELFRVEPPPEYNVLEDDLLAANGMLALFKRAFAGETVHVPTFWYDPRDLKVINVTEGRRVAISMTIFPLFKPNGEIDYVAATYKDETEIMLAHEALREMNENLERTVQARTAQLQAAYRELEAFSYSVAHDLRAPLQGMTVVAQVLLKEYGDKLDAEASDFLQQIEGNALLMAKLIDALLSLARLGKSELRPQPVDLAGLARSAGSARAAVETDRAVEMVVAGRLETKMDPALARTLIDNLVDNAWKFTRKTPVARVEVGAADVGGTRAFYVRDNGAGFDMASAGKLFTAFHRLHAPGDFPGTGIGLATCHRIVDRHGGRIWAEGQVGKGATIFFTVPAGG